ncbi:hypothetical protein FIBSPDRAFT_199128 [Athelia psychrophila]|uniref:Uncharacterized protein n=1 Tax=Athelia psychrophila TaxID=1759441 RepID=A0A165ZPS7_9AGAM|nr:hypothetical protein FIBSPDRAFT_199128 [Fibularhizoctonia sp. CBS 109695]
MPVLTTWWPPTSNQTPSVVCVYLLSLYSRTGSSSALLCLFRFESHSASPHLSPGVDYKRRSEPRPSHATSHSPRFHAFSRLQL